MPFNSVLIVDDSADDILLTRRALERLRDAPCVHSMTDSVEAFGKLTEEGADLPDLILLDIRMPRVNGLELLAKLRTNPQTKGLCVVMLTSSDETPDIEVARHWGANSYLVKPVDPSEYLAIIDNFGEVWTETGQCPDFWPKSN